MAPHVKATRAVAGPRWCGVMNAVRWKEKNVQREPKHGVWLRPVLGNTNAAWKRCSAAHRFVQDQRASVCAATTDDDRRRRKMEMELRPNFGKQRRECIKSRVARRNSVWDLDEWKGLMKTSVQR